MNSTTPTSGTRYSIVVPCYNEEQGLMRTVERILSAMQDYSDSTEVVIVDDGSSDNSLGIAQSLSAHYSNVRSIALEYNQGKGAAVRTGMLRSRGKYRAFIDGDMDIDPMHLPVFFMTLEQQDNVDLVVGSKFVHGKSVHATWQRKAMSSSYKLVNHSLFRLPVADTQVGIKVFSDSAATTLFSNMRSERFAFDLECLVRAHHLGFAIQELGVHIDRKSSSHVSIKEIVHMLRDTLRTYHDYLHGKIQSAVHKGMNLNIRMARHAVLYPASWIGIFILTVTAYTLEL